eukprot:7510287-Ditylum_brightwellii.AAC.1
MLQYDEIVDNELMKSGTLVSDAEYMSPAMKYSKWYVKLGIETVIVSMENVLVSNLDVNIVTSTLELDYFMKSVTQEDVTEKEPFRLSAPQ